MRMGLREANQNFSKAIKAVKQGKEVVLTERGKPIAVIKPLETRKIKKRSFAVWRRRVAASGSTARTHAKANLEGDSC